MATTIKFTITLDTRQFDEIKRLVAAKKADSVSGFVRQAIATSLDDAVGWRETLDQMLEETGGPLTDAERAWADDILGIPKSKRRKGRSR